MDFLFPSGCAELTGGGLAAYKLGAYKRNFTVRNSFFSMILVEK